MNTITINLGKEEALRLVEYLDTLWGEKSSTLLAPYDDDSPYQPISNERAYLNKLKSMRDYLIKCIKNES